VRKNDGVGQGMDTLRVRWWLDAVTSPHPWIGWTVCSGDDVTGANDFVDGLKWKRFPSCCVFVLSCSCKMLTKCVTSHRICNVYGENWFACGV